MRVFVTGGAGYIGSHTAKALATAGHQPVVYDNLSTGHRWACQWGPRIEADILDTERLRQAFKAHRIEAVIHFAASAYVGESMTNARAYYHNNVVGSLSLLDAMVSEGVGAIVFSSSCATYGIPDQLPITESTPQKPVNTYGETKLAIERALHWHQVAHGLRYAALRYFNASGASKDGELGEAHDPETHLLPLAIDAALGTRDPLKIFGTDYPTRDGTCERDYVHVEDLASAHLAALDKLAAGADTIACNIGTGQGATVQECCSVIEACCGRPVPTVPSPRRAGDPPSLVADVSLASTLLDWRPANGITEIVADAVAWHQRQLAARS
ncbi:MAG: UDP-glucose 4-epimerase GalE [Thermomicrobiales bacterium]|nr:UDP-glucose 4-epimerase GalE [Thermomicrobiales bacterium]